MNRPQAVAECDIDDDRVCVTRFTFEPGAETGWHTHGHDYVIAAISECLMRLEEPNGVVRDVDVAAGEVYRRDQGVQHNVINRGDQTMVFVEIELK